MSHLADKAKQIAERTKAAVAKTEVELDELAQKLADAEVRKDAAMAKITAVHADLNAGVDEIDSVGQHLSNQ